MWRAACVVVGAVAAVLCDVAAGAGAAGVAAAGAAGFGAAEPGADVVCAKAPAGRASAATSNAVVTECLSVIVMSSRMTAQRDGAAGHAENGSIWGLFGCPNNSFVLPQ